MSDNNGKMLKTAGLMVAATMLAKIFGMLRNSLISNFYGLGIEASAYITALRLPTMLFDIVIGGVISAAFIPVFNEVWQKQSKDNAIKFAGKFITMIVMICILITAGGIIFSDKLIYFLAPEFSPEQHELSRQLSNIMFPMIIFTGIAFSFVGILQSFGEYNIPSIISLVSNSAIILYFIICRDRFGIKSLAVMMIVAWSLQVLVQIPSLIKFKFKYYPSLHLRDENIIHTLKLAGPMLITAWVQPLYSVVNMRIASGMDGAVVMLENANNLYTIVVGVFSFVVTNLIFPKLSRANVSDRADEAKSLIVTSLKAICIVIIPLMAGFIILSRPIISIIYEHGAFTAEAAVMTGRALACYSVGMLGLAVNEILSKYFFSMQDSKTPFFTALTSMVCNIVLAYTLSAVMGMSGLALAVAFGSIINALLNYIFLRKRCGKILEKSDVISVVKIAVSALIMAAAVYAVYTLIKGYATGFVGNTAVCGICAVLGAAVYFGCCMLIGVDEIKAVIKGLKTGR